MMVNLRGLFLGMLPSRLLSPHLSRQPPLGRRTPRKLRSATRSGAFRKTRLLCKSWMIAEIEPGTKIAHTLGSRLGDAATMEQLVAS